MPDAASVDLPVLPDRSAARVGLRWAIRDVATVTAVAVLLGLIRLGAPSLWVDEAFTARAVDRSLPDLLDRQYHFLYYSMMKPWTLVAGTSEWALRLPSVLGAVLACALLMILARKLFDRCTAVVSGLFLAASPFLVKWSQQGRSYTLLLAIGLLATLLLLRALERGSRAAWALYGFVVSIVVVWHPVSGLLLLPTHAVLVGQQRQRALPHVLLASAVIVTVALPWAAVAAIRSVGEGVAMNWLVAPTPQNAARTVLDVSGAAGIGVVLAVIGVLTLWRAGSSQMAVWLGAWAVTPFVLALAVSTVRPIYLDRYLIIAAPAFALLAGVAVVGVGTRVRVALVVAAVVASSVGLAHWYLPREGGNWRGEDWRRAVQTVGDRRSAGDAIVVAEWPAAPAAEYYGVDVLAVSTADSIWVLLWSEEGRNLQRAERRALGFGEHRLVERIPFGRRLSAQLWKR